MWVPVAIAVIIAAGAVAYVLIMWGVGTAAYAFAEWLPVPIRTGLAVALIALGFWLVRYDKRARGITKRRSSRFGSSREDDF